MAEAGIILTPAAVPVGAILPYAGSTPPEGWLVCDGAEVVRADYPGLFAVLGETYGAGDGQDTFNLPDLRMRVPLGAAAQPRTTLGQVLGEEYHTLTLNELPVHRHGIAFTSDAAVVPNNLDLVLGGSQTWSLAALGTFGCEPPGDGLTTEEGGGVPFALFQPSLVLQFLVKT